MLGSTTETKPIKQTRKYTTTTDPLQCHLFDQESEEGLVGEEDDDGKFISSLSFRVFWLSTIHGRTILHPEVNRNRAGRSQNTFLMM